ncbi:hypothetical protein [Pelosinus sp. IPA-1]|uniref:winged helix-turn-helix transcriptional regulator n=1 Tax=Pelosinus sp. IPA-1 TaxID=3029569 RepID=UPI0024361DD7|nr:hypothetical protein [Pelosinus sp. IPA-1]GMA97780.1 hypothetical protein PIPA1_05800 [Pelosinus sp. IPA-1]
MEEIETVVLTKGIPGEPCPIAKTLDVIGTKWTFLIIRDLLIVKTMRFSELFKIYGRDKPEKFRGCRTLLLDIRLFKLPKGPEWSFWLIN